MTYEARVPGPPLNAYIDWLYYADGPMPYPCERILPYPQIDLKINLGSALQVYGPDGDRTIADCSESWCLGLWERHHVVNWPETTRFIGVSFKPGGAHPFFPIPLSQIHNQVVPLNAIWGPIATEIRDRICSAPTRQARFDLLETVLCDRLQDASSERAKGTRIVEAALDEISIRRGVLSIRGLSEHLNVSHKHLIALFNRAVGATPKEMARLHRFRHVLASIEPRGPVDWTEIAHQSRYFDQSHFNNDFKAFTGHTPTSYLNLRRHVDAERPEHASYLRELPEA